MSDLERCCQCDTPTGRAGRAEDSLYHGDQGPFCEDCFEAVPEQWFKEATRLRAEKAELVEALEGLGVLPDGYCFCFNSRRDANKPEHKHTGECRACRAALSRARETGDAS